MTAEELNRKYTEACWLIAKRSASAAGKALLFDGESLGDTIRQIAAIYGLGADEVASLDPRSDDGAVAGAQKLVQGLFGSGVDAGAGQAVKIGRTAIRNGQAVRMVATLVKAGPKAAQAVASGGKVVSRGAPWAWIATAGYAAGTAGWFAYNARAFNLKAFELVRRREGIVPVDPPAAMGERAGAAETMTFAIDLPTPAALASKAGAMTSKAGAAVTNVFGRFRGPRS